MEPYEEPPPRMEFMPLSILRALWKRGLIILLCWLLISIVGAAIVYSLPAVYQARTIILIERQRIPERYVVSTVNEDLSNRLNRISQQILSYEPLLRLIEEFNLYSDLKGKVVQEEIVQKMRDNIRVSLIEGWAETSAPAFQIVFEGEDPNVVAQITNRLASLFIDENIRTRNNQAQGTTEFLTNQLEEFRQEVERQESLMSDYRMRNNGELPEQRSVLIGELSRLERESQSAQEAIQRAHQSKMMYEASITSARGTLEMLQRMAEEETRGSMRRAAGAMAPAMDPAVIELQKAQDLLQSLEARYSQNHPDVVRARDSVALWKRNVEQNKQLLPPAANEGGEASETPSESAILTSSDLAQSIVRERERIRNFEAQVQLADEQIKAAEATKAAISARMNMIDSRLARIPLHEQELAKVNRDYEISMENYRSLLEKRIEAELSSEMETRQKAEKFTQLDAARLPEKPIRPDRRLLLMVALGAGLFASCAIGFVVELRNNVLLGEWELPPGAPILGQVPFIQFDADGDAATEPSRRRSRLTKFAWIASSLVVAGVIAAGAGVYFGWLPTPF